MLDSHTCGEGHLVLCRISLFLLMPLLGPTAASVRDFFVPGSGIRCYKCPARVASLQHAKLLALVQAFKIAGYEGWRRVAVGSDSMVARSRVLGLRCGRSLPVQNPILRPVFWWRPWSRVQLAIFLCPVG